MILAHFDVFSTLLAGLLLLDFLAYQPLWEVWFSRSCRPWWLLALVALASPFRYWKLAGTLILWALFRKYFISQRWTQVRRGGGAPGFMAHWAMMHLASIQLAVFLDGSGYLSQQALWVARVDFAVIMICAGFYKYCVGYLHHDGMEYGRVNPMWGYHWRFFSQKSPAGIYPQIMNRLACLVEIVGGILMLIPGLRHWGAIAISLSFLYVSLFIRLGRLAWLMALLPLIFFPEMGNTLQSPGLPSLNIPAPAILVLGSLATLYVALLPLVKLTQYLNLFYNRRWPAPLQGALDSYANFVPIIIWRVFTPDVTNFFVRIYDAENRTILDEETYSLKGWKKPWLKFRMLHVCESIALTSVFTTLRYFPSKPELFAGRLLEYSKSLGKHQALRYELVAIRKGQDRFLFEVVEEIHVNLLLGTVERTQVSPDYRFSSPSRYSPVREATKPGSYVAASNSSSGSEQI